MHASHLQAIRLSVANLAAARHFWESALGFRCVGETEVNDPILRRIWGTEGGEMRAARLERAGSSRIELFHWEGCTGQPIRDPRRPWDHGVIELQLQCAMPDRLIVTLQHHCEMLGEGAFLTPFGERCKLLPDTGESVVLSVPSSEECDLFFSGFLGWHLRDRLAITNGFTGTASISLCETTIYSSNGGGAGSVEANRFVRRADPRIAQSTAERMSPAYTGVWMLTACVESVIAPEASVVEVPFVGRRRAVVTRAPGGVRFGVFERDAR